MGFIIGFVIDSGIHAYIKELVYILLLILIGVVGIAIGINIDKVKHALKNLQLVFLLTGSTITGSILGGAIVAIQTSTPIDMALAITLGMGWYTFTGSYIGLINPLYGMIAFSANLLREILMFTMYPFLSKKYRLEGICIGGAATMDSTLPIVLRFGGTDVAVLAFLHGFILTLIIPVIIPLVIT